MLCILQGLTLQLLTIKSLILSEYTWRNLTFNNTWYRRDLPVRSQPSRQTWTSLTPHRLYCLVGVMNTDYFTGLLFFLLACEANNEFTKTLYYLYPGSQKKIVRSPYWYRKPHWHKTVISSSDFFFLLFMSVHPHKYPRATTSRTSQKTKVLHTHTNIPSSF